MSRAGPGPDTQPSGRLPEPTRFGEDLTATAQQTFPLLSHPTPTENCRRTCARGRTPDLAGFQGPHGEALPPTDRIISFPVHRTSASSTRDSGKRTPKSLHCTPKPPSRSSRSRSFLQLGRGCPRPRDEPPLCVASRMGFLRVPPWLAFF